MSIRLAREDDDFAETHEINVTPFIDVILVLLIIFMIAPPLATVDVAVLMSALGHKRTCPLSCDVRFTPESGHAAAACDVR